MTYGALRWPMLRVFLLFEFTHSRDVFISKRVRAFAFVSKHAPHIQCYVAVRGTAYAVHSLRFTETLQMYFYTVSRHSVEIEQIFGTRWCLFEFEKLRAVH